MCVRVHLHNVLHASLAGPRHVCACAHMHADRACHAWTRPSMPAQRQHLVLDALRLLVGQVLLNVQRVHDRHDRVQAQPLRQEVVHEEGLRDRGRVRQACGSMKHWIICVCDRHHAAWAHAWVNSADDTFLEMTVCST